VTTTTVTCYSWAPFRSDHMWRHLPAATSLPSPLTWNCITYHSHFADSQFSSSTLALWFKTIFNGGCYWGRLMAFLPGALRAPFIAVDCIALNCRGKQM